MRQRLTISPMWRALAVVATLMVAFACVADVAHTAGGDTGDCPQGKLETQRLSPASGEVAVLPERFAAVDATELAGLIEAETLPTARSILVRRSPPRAPPLA